MDDGNASAGKLVATPGIADPITPGAWQAGCVSATNFGAAAGTVNYDLTSGDTSCRLIYFLQGIFK